VTVTHLVVRLEVADDRLVLVEPTVDDDPLPLGDGATVLLFNGGKGRRGPLLRPSDMMQSSSRLD
jgi:hypothetical protein